MENSNSIKDIITNSLKEVRNILDADTIVGQPIKLDNGTSIIPISKVSMGICSGGLDLPSSAEAKNFGGGGGTGVTVSPVGFLIASPDGKVEMIPMAPEKMSTFEQVADLFTRAPDIIEQVKGLIGKKPAPETKQEEAKEEVFVENVADDLTEKLDPKAAKRAEKAALKEEKKKRKEEKRLSKQG